MNAHEKGKLLIRTFELLHSKLMDEPIEQDELESLRSGLGAVAISEPDVEIASIFAYAVQAVLLSYPHPGRNHQFYGHIQNLFDEVKERVRNLGEDKKAIFGWNIPLKKEF